MHRGDEGAHPLALGGGEGAGVLAAARQLGAHPGIGRRAQRHVHGGAALGNVDRLAGEQAAAEAVQVCVGELEQRHQRLAVDRGLREIERQILERCAEPVRARGIGGEQGADAAASGRAARSASRCPGQLRGGDWFS